MAYNKHIEEYIHEVVKNYEGISSKKMFGGLAYMMYGNMLVGVHKGFMILRLNEKDAQEAMGVPHSKLFDITGRPMKGWIMLEGEKCNEDDYVYWIEKARSFVMTLPKK